MIILDASVIIAFIETTDPHHPRSVSALRDAATEEFSASTVTLAEALVAPAQAGKAVAMKEGLRTIGIIELSLPPDAAEQLALLRAQTGLKLPDCCVLLTAIDAEATVMTFDDRLARAADALGVGPAGR